MSELRGGILLTTHGIETAAAYRRRRAQAAGLPSNNQLRNEGTEGEPGVDSYNITLNQSSMDGISVDWKKNGTEPLTFAAVVARVLPSTMSAFVTLFGTKISTVVRISSVFWASASALAMPAIKELRDTGQFTVDVFLSLAGGVYAGSVGSFVAVKKRGFGILVQGMALGAIISDMCKGFVMAWVVEQVLSAFGTRALYQNALCSDAPAFWTEFWYELSIDLGDCSDDFIRCLRPSISSTGST